jgi:hypothetical protein
MLLSPTLAEGQEATLVQQIGELSGEVAEAVGEQVNVVPFSPQIDARTTPIIVAPGEAFVQQGRPGQVGGLSGAERKAIRQAYDAGQTILLLHGSVHDIDALHVLVKDGVTHRSSTDPTVLAYALRQESDIPTVRVVHDLRPSLRAPGGIGPDFEDEGALQRALDVIVSELIHAPVVGAAPPPIGDAPSGSWSQSPVQTAVLTSTSNGIYNTPISIYALHSCKDNHDYYLVDTGGDWTATEAQFLSASWKAGQLSLPSSNGNIVANFESDTSFCTGGISVAAGQDERLCRYTPYPLYYEVDIVPQPGPTVIQLNAKPAGNQGVSTSYSSGFSISFDGGVNISGDGPSGGIQAGATWSNETTTTTVPLLLSAGDQGNEGTFTRYQYCTVGSSLADCDSNIQIGGQSGLCQDFIAGQPQQGQTPNGRLSDVAQTVEWQVDPTTYIGNAFIITVTWQVDMAVSEARLWWDQFIDPRNHTDGGPGGSCNSFGCSCSMSVSANVDAHSVAFVVPFPSQKCPSG